MSGRYRWIRGLRNKTKFSSYGPFPSSLRPVSLFVLIGMLSASLTSFAHLDPLPNVPHTEHSKLHSPLTSIEIAVSGSVGNLVCSTDGKIAFIFGSQGRIQMTPLGSIAETKMLTLGGHSPEGFKGSFSSISDDGQYVLTDFGKVYKPTESPTDQMKEPYFTVPPPVQTKGARRHPSGFIPHSHKLVYPVRLESYLSRWVVLDLDTLIIEREFTVPGLLKSFSPQFDRASYVDPLKEGWILNTHSGEKLSLGTSTATTSVSFRGSEAVVLRSQSFKSLGGRILDQLTSLNLEHPQRSGMSLLSRGIDPDRPRHNLNHSGNGRQNRSKSYQAKYQPIGYSGLAMIRDFYFDELTQKFFKPQGGKASTDFRYYRGNCGALKAYFVPGKYEANEHSTQAIHGPRIKLFAPTTILTNPERVASIRDLTSLDRLLLHQNPIAFVTAVEALRVYHSAPLQFLQERAANWKRAIQREMATPQSYRARIRELGSNRYAERERALVALYLAYHLENEAAASSLLSELELALENSTDRETRVRIKSILQGHAIDSPLFKLRRIEQARELIQIAERLESPSSPLPLEAELASLPQ